MIGAITAGLLAPTTSAPVLNYQQTVLTDNPISFWMMDETSGSTATDLGSAGQNSTYITSPTLNVSTGLTGLPKGVTFNGTDQLMSTGFVSSYNLAANGSWSAEGWFRTTATGVGTVLAIRGADTGTDGDIICALFTNIASGKLSAFVTQSGGGGYVSINSTTTINTGAYFYAAVTATSGGALKLYINGTEEASTTAARSSVSVNRKFSVAAQSASTPPYQTYLAETAMAPAFYSTVLSPTRITAHYNKGI